MMDFRTPVIVTVGQLIDLECLQDQKDRKELINDIFRKEGLLEHSEDD